MKTFKTLFLLFVLLIYIPCMASVSTTSTKVTLDCDGSDTTFNFSFPIVETSDLIVILRTVSTGVETVLTETTHYSVSATNNDFSDGGTVTTVATYANIYTITLFRDIPDTQETTLSDTGVLRLAALEDAYDRLTMLVQQLQESDSRSLRIPRSDSTSLTMEFDDSVSRASSYPYFGTDGDLTTTSSVASDNTVISSFMEGFVDDATAGAGRKTLGINYDVVGYGAVVDGLTDGSSAIQDAIDDAYAAGGGTAKLSIAGNYYIASTLVPKSNVTLEGVEGAVIYFTGITAIDSDAAVANFTVKNLIFDGQSGNSKAIVIDDATSTFIKIIDCEIHDCDGVAGAAITIIAANYVWIQNNNVHDCRTGIITANSSWLLIEDNQIRDIGPAGGSGGEVAILVWGTAGTAGTYDVKYVRIVNNQIETIADNGIKIHSQSLVGDGSVLGTVRFVTVAGNIVKDIEAGQTGGDCYRLIASDMTVFNNVAVDAKRSAYRASGGSNVVIANNVAAITSARDPNISAAIYWVLIEEASAASNISITGNVIISDQWRSGIWCAGSLTEDNTGQGLLIANNTIIDTGTDTPNATGALAGIYVSRWNDVKVTNNRLDNTYEGIYVTVAADATIKNNDVVNCVDGSGRAIRTTTVTRAVVSDNYLHGNTTNYDLDTADTRLIEPVSPDEFVFYENDVISYENETVTSITTY